jgi:hypothetical protein
VRHAVARLSLDEIAVGLVDTSLAVKIYCLSFGLSLPCFFTQESCRSSVLCRPRNDNAALGAVPEQWQVSASGFGVCSGGTSLSDAGKRLK